MLCREEVAGASQHNSRDPSHLLHPAPSTHCCGALGVIRGERDFCSAFIHDTRTWRSTSTRGSDLFSMHQVDSASPRGWHNHKSCYSALCCYQGTALSRE